MSIIANIAKALLKLDGHVQTKFAEFWQNRSTRLRASATAFVRQAEGNLTTQLVTLEKQYKQDVERVMRQLSDRKDDAVDKAYARRDFDVIDAQWDLSIANTLSDTAIACRIKSGQAIAAIKALSGGV